MPELAEVETFRKIAHGATTGATIERAFVADDRIVVEGLAPRTLARRLRGVAVTGSDRYGKHMWLTLGSGDALLLHFGMTGRVTSLSSDQERPRFCKLELQMDDGRRLAFTSARRLGRVRLLTGDPRGQPPLARLGFDPFLALPTKAAFAAAVGRRKNPIKALLLDQTFAAGVGNWIADEVLYQSGIAPTRKASSLSAAEAERLRMAIGKVVNKAVEVEADANRFPRTWLFHVRWGKGKTRKSDHTPGTGGASVSDKVRTNRGEVVEFCEVGGRTTAWVPSRQR